MVELAAGATWHSCGYYILETSSDSLKVGTDQHRVRTPSTRCYAPPPDIEALQQQWFEGATQITTAQEEIYRLLPKILKSVCNQD